MPRGMIPSGIIEHVETVGDRIRTARLAANLGNNELDKAIGRSSGFTSRLETGARTAPRTEALKAIAEATKVSFEWLAFGKGEMQPTMPTRTIERDVPTYSDAEVFFARAAAAGVDEKTIAAARVSLGRHRGEVTEQMAEEALHETITGIARIRERLPSTEQKARVDAMRKGVRR